MIEEFVDVPILRSLWTASQSIHLSSELVFVLFGFFHLIFEWTVHEVVAQGRFTKSKAGVWLFHFGSWAGAGLMWSYVEVGSAQECCSQVGLFLHISIISWKCIFKFPLILQFLWVRATFLNHSQRSVSWGSSSEAFLPYSWSPEIMRAVKGLFSIPVDGVHELCWTQLHVSRIAVIGATRGYACQLLALFMPSFTSFDSFLRQSRLISDKSCCSHFFTLMWIRNSRLWRLPQLYICIDISLNLSWLQLSLWHQILCSVLSIDLCQPGIYPILRHLKAVRPIPMERVFMSSQQCVLDAGIISMKSKLFKNKYSRVYYFRFGMLWGCLLCFASLICFHYLIICFYFLIKFKNKK